MDEMEKCELRFETLKLCFERCLAGEVMTPAQIAEYGNYVVFGFVAERPDFAEVPNPGGWNYNMDEAPRDKHLMLLAYWGRDDIPIGKASAAVPMFGWHNGIEWRHAMFAGQDGEYRITPIAWEERPVF